MSKSRTVGRLQLILIGLVFVGPLIVSFVVYFGGVWKPENSSINGVLLDEPAVLPDEPFSEAISTSSFRKKWSLIHVTRNACDESCRETLYTTRQVRQALNRDKGRVQRVLCDIGSSVDKEFLKTEHPGLFVVNDDYPACSVFLEMFADSSNRDVFLADPLGNLIIHFPPETGMRGMHRDMKKLLRVSRIG